MSGEYSNPKLTNKIDTDKGDKKLRSLINLGTLNPGPDPWPRPGLQCLAYAA